MNGILLIDKPSGPTSHDIVDKIRRALKEKKVGHTGTLDPLATGVLPLVLGSATKLARYLSGSDKTYAATFQLGVTTTTLDAAGEILQERPVNVTEDQVREILQRFTGDMMQVPPMYSAKKQQGKRLYELAREGKEVEREAKKVIIKRFDLMAFLPTEIAIEVECSTGTYVRVLAQDIGEALGCGAFLKTLRRTKAGPFSIEQSIPLEEALNNPEKIKIIPAFEAFSQMPRLDIPGYLAKRMQTGYQLQVADLKTLDTPDFQQSEAVLVGIEGGDLIAVTRAELASGDLACFRRDACALKTERMLTV